MPSCNDPSCCDNICDCTHAFCPCKDSAGSRVFENKEEELIVAERNLTAYLFDEKDKSLIHLCPADLDSVVSRLEEMKESIIREWGRNMMDVHAESRYLH
jgi:hypothetical protein